jgi:hypothetical protein
MSRTLRGIVALVCALALALAACTEDEEGGDEVDTDTTDTVAPEDIDYEALGLWDDGPCDEARDPLVIGLMTVFQSPVISLEDQAQALEASAAAFNERGGANGACIEVHTCDDGGNVDHAVACVREIDDAGVMATVNDQGTAGQAEVSQGMADAGIPRIASNVASQDWGDQNAYPTDASGTGVTFLLPQALVEAGVTEIGIVRVDLAAASAIIGLLEGIYEGQATFPVDVPVPAGTTDFGQFILKAQDEGAGGVSLALGEQEAVQVVRAGQQLGSELKIGASLGTFPHSTVVELGDFAEQMVFLGPYPPATYTEVPVYDVIRADLAASGVEALQPEHLKASPMRSWIGLYALLWMIRDAEMTEFSRDSLKSLVEETEEVPMLDIFGGENWTPDADHPGLFSRAGIDRWQVWSWDPEAEGPGGLEGNFVPGAEISFDAVLCGSPFGGPEPC